MKNYIFSPKLIQLLFLIFPITFVLGNGAVNISILLISILGIILYKEEIFRIREKKFILPIIIFFVYLIVLTIISDIRNIEKLYVPDGYYKNIETKHVIKSFLFLRYLIFMLVINCMVQKGDFKLKPFLLSCLVISSVIALDVIFQYFNGSNLIGFDRTTYHSPSFFDRELVSGAFIHKFFLLGILIIPVIFRKNSKIDQYLYAVFLSIGFISIVFSGNRMPVLLILVFLSLSIFFIKELRRATIFSALISLFFVLSFADENLKKYYNSFSDNIIGFVNTVDYQVELTKKNKEFKYINPKDFDGDIEKIKRDLIKQNKNIITFGGGHLIHFLTAIDVWDDSPLFGGGYRSFLIKCHSKIYLGNRACNIHPHNYYLEILVNTGIIGFVLLLLTIIFLMINRLRANSEALVSDKNKFIFYSILFALVAEIFPIRSSGSFFSTFNAAYFFMLTGLFLSLRVDKIK